MLRSVYEYSASLFQALRNLWKDRSLTRWWQQIIIWYLFRRLMLLRPLPDSIEVPALVLRVEVWIGLWSVLVPPDLAEHAEIYGAHQLLAECIEAVSCEVRSASNEND